LAPSAHNRQPWRFAVVTSYDQRRDLALAMGSRLRADLAADNVPIDVIEKDASPFLQPHFRVRLRSFWCA